MKTIERPSDKIIEFLNWAVEAAMTEFSVSTDDHSDYNDTCDWLDTLKRATDSEKVDD